MCGQERGEGDERRERLYEQEPLKSAVWSKLAAIWTRGGARAQTLKEVRVRGDRAGTRGKK